MIETEPMDRYDMGLMNDYGGGNVEWWHDYLRSAVDSANDNADEQYEHLRTELKAQAEELAREKKRGYGLEADLVRQTSGQESQVRSMANQISRIMSQRDTAEAAYKQKDIDLARKDDALKDILAECIDAPNVTDIIEYADKALSDPPAKEGKS